MHFCGWMVCRNNGINKHLWSSIVVKKYFCQSEWGHPTGPEQNNCCLNHPTNSIISYYIDRSRPTIQRDRRFPNMACERNYTGSPHSYIRRKVNWPCQCPNIWYQNNFASTMPKVSSREHSRCSRGCLDSWFLDVSIGESLPEFLRHCNGEWIALQGQFVGLCLIKINNMISFLQNGRSETTLCMWWFSWLRIKRSKRHDIEIDASSAPCPWISWQQSGDNIHLIG